MNIRNWVLGAVFLVEGVSVNAQQQAPRSFYDVQREKGKTKKYSVPNGSPVTKNVIDVSYDKLVKYACKHWREIDWNRLGRNESERILRKMRLLTFAGQEFAEKVLPKDITDKSKLFIMDPKFRPFEFEFIKEILKAILRNPVGEARVKSILLLSCLQEAGLIGGHPILATDDGGFQEQIVVTEHVECTDWDNFGTFYDNTLDMGNIFLNIAYGYQFPKNKRVSKCEIEIIKHLLTELWNKRMQYNSVNVAKEEIKEEIRGGSTFIESEILKGFNIIATAMIHEMSHTYHGHLGFDDSAIGSCQDFFQGCMRGHEDMRAYWGNDVSWDYILDEMLTIAGFCPYRDGDDKFIIEDRVNENTARLCVGQPFVYFHHYDSRVKGLNQRLNHDTENCLNDFYRNDENINCAKNIYSIIPCDPVNVEDVFNLDLFE